jgi:hypothetical protein
MDTICGSRMGANASKIVSFANSFASCQSIRRRLGCSDKGCGLMSDVRDSF